jgi:hypothetical protein
MPRRKKSSLSAIQNLSHTTTHLNHQDSLADDHPPDIQAETGDAANVEEALGEVEYLGDVAGEEIWQEDAVMELIAKVSMVHRQVGQIRSTMGIVLFPWQS